MIAPALDELAASYAGRAKIVKVDIDQNRTSAMKYHVRSIPTLLLFKDGQVQATADRRGRQGAAEPDDRQGALSAPRPRRAVFARPPLT